MKHLLRCSFLLVMLSTFGLSVLTGCNLSDGNWNINEGFDDFVFLESDYTFDISASLDEITFEIDEVCEDGKTGTLVALSPHEYLYDETVKGLSNDTFATPIEIETFEGGQPTNIKIPRYFENGTDGIYLKYYILGEDDEILVGPKYCTQIQAQNYFKEDPIKPINIKGVMCEDMYQSEVKDLGCSYTQINMVIDSLVVPNEIFNKQTGKIEQLNYAEKTDENGNLTISLNGQEESVEKLEYNGKTYYFRTNSNIFPLSAYDNMIRRYTQDGVKVTLILLIRLNQDQYIQPYFMSYPALHENGMGGSHYMQVNTSNELGAGYWGAIMEFLGRRYSNPTMENGNVQTFVLGNEIDMSSSWNRIVPLGHSSLTLENYIEEYERQMRIANQALKKYCYLNKVLVPVTHYWTSKAEEYAPKNILDYLMLKTAQQGNYDYGFALHSYGVDLTRPDFWQADLNSAGMTGNLNTARITWSNLEVMQLYLEQPSKLYNGNVRKVYLTEGGVSSNSQLLKTMTEENKNKQAAGIAYAYYKSTQLSCIEAFMYYRLQDRSAECAYFGLMTEDKLHKKPSYEMYKYIDTSQSFEVTRKYLKYIEWAELSAWNTIPHGEYIGNVTSFQDTMALFKSKFDWSTHWDESLIIRRDWI